MKYFLLFFILIPSSLFCEVFYSMSSSPETLTAGRPWRLTILIDYNNPNEVMVAAPQFEPFFTLDRIVKTSRSIAEYETVHEWSSNVLTFVEYTLTPVSPGIFFVGAFTIITPDGIVHTTTHLLDVREARAEVVRLTPRVFWEGQPQVLEAGERAIFDLRVTNLDTSILNQNFFLTDVPKGLIFASLPLTNEEREEGIGARFSLILLENDLFLPRRTLQHENIIFNIPELRVRITERTAAEDDDEEITEQETENNSEQIVLKPAFPGFDIFAENLNKIKNLWNEENYAKALAELRRLERENVSELQIRNIRREAEEALGIFNTENESRGEAIFRSRLSSIFLGFVIIFPFICYIILRKSGITRKRLSVLAAVFLVLAVFSVFLRFTDIFIGGGGNRSGIAKEVSVLSLPDINGSELFILREGQPAEVMLDSGTWLYIRTKDIEGRNGWIPAESLVFY